MWGLSQTPLSKSRYRMISLAGLALEVGCFLIATGHLANLAAQSFRITETSVDHSGRFSLQHESRGSFYYILYQGDSIMDIRFATDLALGAPGTGRLDDPTPAAARGSSFYRVLEVPLSAPFDSDADGMDDLFELQREFLNPLDPIDSSVDFDGDGRSNLEEYRANTDPGTSDPPALTVIAQTSPRHGEGGVAVTRETLIRLSNPLAPSVVINSNQLFAEYGGGPLQSRIELASDRRKATLFYTEPLPDGARVRVSFDTANIADVYGNPVDADGDGTAGGVAMIEFETLSLNLFPGTAVCGRVFASELAPAGANQLSVNVPLQGVTITVDGKEESMSAVTDQNGDFRLEPVPAGRFFVHIDGRTASNNAPAGAYYPFVGKAWESVPGEEVNIGEVYLPLVVAGTLQPINDTNATVIGLPPSVLAERPELAGVGITVPANALFNDDGMRGGMAGIAPVPPDRLPGALPLGLAPPLVITVQTDGPSNFDAPVSACFPNLPDPITGQILPSGAKSALFSFNHDAGRFEVAGAMTVNADGSLVCTDPGVGIPAPGWHFSFPITQVSGGSVRDGETVDPPVQPEPTEVQEPTNEDECPADAACRTSNTVYLHNGEEVFDRIDLMIPGRGDIHFRMRRTYRSQLDYDGPLGHGWNYDYNEALFIRDSGDVVRANGGSHVDTWRRNADGSYQSPTGFYSTLRQRADGTFVLRRPDGFQRFYRADGRLFCHRDRYGNQMLFDYDARGNLAVAVDPFGREIDFVFETFSDGKDRLRRVIDFTGREIVYSYDANFDLVAARTPVVTGTSTGNDFPNGRTERYTYSSGFAQAELNHNLLTVTYPEEVALGGPPALVWTYGTNTNDPVTFDRVLTETEGGVNASGVSAGGTMTFVYEMLNEGAPPGDPDLPRGKVTITERNGNVFEYFANELNHHIMTRRLTRGLRSDAPAFYETRSFFDQDGQLVRRVLPEGNEIRYRYDSGGPRAANRNMVEGRRVADPNRGGGEDLVTVFTYEPLYNRIASVTDPRGNATGFAPPIGTASSARYVTRFFYDYQESSDPVEQAVELGIDLSGVARGLGDLNGDGRTDQTTGNLIRTEAPTVTLLPDSNEAARLGDTQQPIVTQIQWNDRGQSTAVIDAEGNVNEFFYHPENDPDGDGRTTPSAYLALTSQGTGYLRSSVVDSQTSSRRSATAPPAELETGFRYDPVGNITAMSNPRGVVTAIEYNQLNEPVVITRGQDVSVAVASGQLLRNDPPLRYRSRMHYDFNGRVVRREVENRDSTTIGVGGFVDRTYTHDILDNVLQSTVEIDNATALTTQYRYDPDELLTLVTQPEGNQSQTIYDERNLPFRVTRGLGSPGAATIEVNYDLNANRLEIIDAEDNDGDGQPERTTFVYDGFDRRTETVDALGNRSVLGYDVAGNVIRHRAFGHPPGQPAAAHVLLSDRRFLHDELNRVFQADAALFLSEGFNPIRPVDLRDENSDGLVTTRLEYDALSRPTFSIEDDLQMTRTVYDGADRPLESVDHLGNRLRTTYDRNSNPIRVESVELSPEGLVPNESFVTHYVYDQLDRVVRVTDNAGQTARFAYDSRDNLIFRSDPEGSSIPDPLGLFPGQINQAGNTVTWFYDGLDRRMLQVADLRVDGQGGNPVDTSNPFNPDGQIALGYEYDGNSRLTGIVDDNGNRTRIHYDALDRRIRQTNADGEEFVTVYDRDDNPRQITDPNGTTIQNTFDALNRRTRTSVERAAGVGGTTHVTFEYDGLSRQTRSADDNGAAATAEECEYIYDSLSRVLEDRQNGQPVTTVWSGDGKRVRCVYPGGRTIDLAYDPIDRVKSVADQAAPISDSAWIGRGLRELRRNYANNTRLSFLDDAGNADIGYDAVQRIHRLRHLRPDGKPLADREYGYNRADMRTFERRQEHFGLTDRYTYDSTYRVARTQLDQEGQAGAQPRDVHELGYVYDGVGNRRQLERISVSTGAAADLFSVNVMNEYDSINETGRVHDDNGNLTDDGTRLMTYDYKNRLIEVRDKASGEVIANYFYLADNRRTRKVVNGTPTKATDFFYDGWQVVEERDSQSDQTEVTYIYGSTYIDESIQMQRTAAHPLGVGTFFYHQNARYDVIALTGEDGSVAEEVLYDDFGNPTILGAVPSPLFNSLSPEGKKKTLK